MEALTKAVRQGKTRYVGFSEWPLDKIEAAAKMPGVVRFVSSSAAIFAAPAHPAKKDFPALRRTRHRRDRLVAARPGDLDRQIQTGRAASGKSRAAHGSMGAMLPKRWLRVPLLTAVQQVKLLAEREAGVTLTQFALAWVLRKQEVSLAIIGHTSRTSGGERRRGRMPDCARAFREGQDILAPLREGPLTWRVARRFRTTAQAFLRRILGARGGT